MKRSVKPRAPVAIAPAMVSQLNCEPLLAVDPRRYLDLVLPLCKGHVIPVGKLRLVPLDVAVDALRGLTVYGDDEAPPADDPRQPETAEAVLAALGLEMAR